MQSFKLRLMCVRDFFKLATSELLSQSKRKVYFLDSEEKLRVSLNLKNVFFKNYNFVYITKKTGNSLLSELFGYYLKIFGYLCVFVFSSFIEHNLDKFSFFCKAYHDSSEYSINSENLSLKNNICTAAMNISFISFFHYFWILKHFPSNKSLLRKLVIFSISNSHEQVLFPVFLNFTLIGLLC